MRNNYNGYNRQELYNNQYRKKQRRKMRRRRVVFYTITGLVFAVGLFFAGDYVMGILQKTDSPVKSVEVETPTEEVAADDLVKFVKGEGNVAIDFASTLPPKIDFNAIEPGKNHSIKASSYAYPLEEVKQWMKGEGSFEDKKIAFLTFDDGPVYNTMKVLDVLKEKNVPGTFFIPGNALASYDDKTILNRYIEEGHGIAIHSYSHDYKYLYPNRTASPDRIVEEFFKTRDLMRETLGDTFDTKVFRFPGGAMSWKNIPAAQEALKESGVMDVDWNSMSGDSEPQNRRPESVQAMGDFVFKTLDQNNHTNVAMVLMHDLKEATPEYLGRVIDGFIERGYSFGIIE